MARDSQAATTSGGRLPIQLDVWREIGRHVEIVDAVDRVAPMLARHLPIDLVLVRRLDVERGRLETVGAGLGRHGVVPAHARTDLGDAAKAVLAWMGTGELVRGDARSPSVARLVPSDVSGPVTVGPLAGPDGPLGVLVLASPRPLSAEHLAVVRDLLEPFAIALGNDRRVHELARLREAVEADNRALLSRLERQDITDTVVGGEAGLREVMERVAQVAPTDAPVLILGETGSGKEVLARQIHARSRRSKGPMVRVNCGAIPPELVDSELFGHEKGSFTGAVATRKGWFERADGGTLFLDEIGELPLAAQVRLLRVLQEGALERVGGGRPIEVDVRIVAATHRDLVAMVAEKRFREDLWYRIGVFPVRLPPLRDRVEDIPALAAHFAWRAGKRLVGQPLAPSAEDVALLVGYPWPGNVRELAAVVERAAILGGGKRLEVAAALGVAPARKETTPVPSERTSSTMSSSTSFPTLEQAMARHIEAALTKCHGRIEGPRGAAALLGINPHTLRSRMRKMNLDWSRFRAED